MAANKLNVVAAAAASSAEPGSSGAQGLGAPLRVPPEGGGEKSRQLLEMKTKQSSSTTTLGLAKAFRSGGAAGQVGPQHDPALSAQDCLCCTPKSLVEMAEEQDRKMRQEGTATRSGPRLQILMAVVALLALGLRLRKGGFAKL